MKRLFIGCRVRILWSAHWPELAGQEGRIVGKCEAAGGPNNPGEWEVAPVSWGRAAAPSWASVGGIFAPHSEQLEPILPDGHLAGTMGYEELMTSLRTETQEQPA